MDRFINKIHLGDSAEVLKMFPNECIDLTVTSPPYDNLRSYKGYSFNFEEIAKELYRVTKKGGVVVWIVNDATVKGNETGTSFKQALFFKDVGFYLHDTMIYEKNTSSFPAKPSGNRYSSIFEYMFVFSKGKPKTAKLICDKQNKWAGTTNWGKNTQRLVDGTLIETSKINSVPKYSPRNNIWRYVVGYRFSTEDKIAYKHPAIFPEKLAEDHIKTWSNENDVVLDCFSGSGTTLKMALLNNRKFIGIDCAKEYIELAKERLKPYMNK